MPATRHACSYLVASRSSIEFAVLIEFMCDRGQTIALTQPLTLRIELGRDGAFDRRRTEDMLAVYDQQLAALGAPGVRGRAPWRARGGVRGHHADRALRVGALGGALRSDVRRGDRGGAAGRTQRSTDDLARCGGWSVRCTPQRGAGSSRWPAIFGPDPKQQTPRQQGLWAR